jgi:hypothetical protein
MASLFFVVEMSHKATKNAKNTKKIFVNFVPL